MGQFRFIIRYNCKKNDREYKHARYGCTSCKPILGPNSYAGTRGVVSD